MRTRTRFVTSVASIAGAALLFTSPSVQAINNFDWKPSLTGAQQWRVDGNWVQPNFPNSGTHGAIVSPSSDLTLNIGLPGADVAVALLTLDATSASTDINISSSGARLVFRNDEDNTSIEPQPESPDVDPILQIEGVNHGRVYVTSTGAAGSTNTISAPVRLNNNGFLEGVDFFGNQSVTITGNVDIVGATAEDVGSPRRHLPT